MWPISSCNVLRKMMHSGSFWLWVSWHLTVYFSSLGVFFWLGNQICNQNRYFTWIPHWLWAHGKKWKKKTKTPPPTKQNTCILSQCFLMENGRILKMLFHNRKISYFKLPPTHNLTMKFNNVKRIAKQKSCIYFFTVCIFHQMRIII